MGSCSHDIDEDWYNCDDSTYLVLDESSGVHVNVTTCRDCKGINEMGWLIVDPADVPMDNFVNPFADDPQPDIFKVVNTDGTTTIITKDLTDNTE